MGVNDRFLISLEKTPDVTIIRRLLESPLGLCRKLITDAFCDDPLLGILRHGATLDDIKKKAAGLEKAEKLASLGCSIASYGVHLFASQQFFHSSYQARQGKVLERVVQEVLVNDVILPERGESKKWLEELYDITEKKDVDVFARRKTDDLVLIIQIRSRDDTGGATAKQSLVNLAARILENDTPPSTKYIISIWNDDSTAQKPTLITKMWEILKEKVGDKYKQEYEDNIETGWKVPNKDVELRLVYGMDNLGDIIADYASKRQLKADLFTTWELLSKWDDLWLAYTLSTIELENLSIKGHSNFHRLKEKISQLKLESEVKKIDRYLVKSKEIATKLIPVWTEELPVVTPADVFTYLRDLVLLMMIHESV